MTRGKKPAAAIEEAKKFAERMGYRWQENTQSDPGYDLFIFKRETAGIVRVRQTAYRIDPDTYYEEILQDDLKSGPLAPVPFVVPYRDLAAHPARAGLAPAPGPARNGGRDRVVAA